MRLTINSLENLSKSSDRNELIPIDPVLSHLDPRRVSPKRRLSYESSATSIHSLIRSFIHLTELLAPISVLLHQPPDLAARAPLDRAGPIKQIIIRAHRRAYGRPVSLYSTLLYFASLYSTPLRLSTLQQPASALKLKGVAVGVGRSSAQLMQAAPK